MKCFARLVAAAIILKGTSGAPIVAKRQPIDDGVILNYALTLEYLERAFYMEGLERFSREDFMAFIPSGEFYGNLKRIAADEAAHVDFLVAGLENAGVTPVKPCNYNFGVSSAYDFVVTSGLLEGVGVSAYLGAAASILEKAYLTAAASILTVEARHSSIIRSTRKQTPFPQPFDTPLSFNQVYSLAVQFITSCPPDNPPLPFRAFPGLTAIGASGPWQGSIRAGDRITLAVDSSQRIDPRRVYAAFIAVSGPIIVTVQPVNEISCEVIIPEQVNGQTYVVLTTSPSEVTDDTTIAGPAILEITNY